MKYTASLLALLTLTSAVYSQTVIDMTGSTAARSATHAAILAVLTGETYAFEGAAGAGASSNRAIYHGTFGGNPYIIRTFWSGSVNGVRDVAQALQQSQLFDTSVLGIVGGQNLSAPLTLAPASAATAPEIGFSDVFQSSTLFSSPPLIVEDEVGIIPFRWYKNEGSSANLTNITGLQARALYGSLGELPLSSFTGIAADAATTVYATGRNADSGSRITVNADMGYGVFPFVNQYTFTTSGTTITGAVFAANSGYSSGGNYSGAVLGSTWASGIVVGYLGSSDWATADGAGAVPLSWNGVTQSTAAIQNGSYSLWGYLHQNRMNLTGNALNFYNALRTEITANPGSVLIKDDSAMTVQRDGDGAPIGPK